MTTLAQRERPRRISNLAENRQNTQYGPLIYFQFWAEMNVNFKIFMIFLDFFLKTGKNLQQQRRQQQQRLQQLQQRLHQWVLGQLYRDEHGICHFRKRGWDPKKSGICSRL